MVIFRANMWRPVSASPCISSRSSHVLKNPRTRSAIFISVEQPGKARLHHPADEYDPDQCHRDEHLPAEPHDLIVAIAGKRRANPQEDEQHESHLQEEPRHAVSERMQ